MVHTLLFCIKIPVGLSHKKMLVGEYPQSPLNAPIRERLRVLRTLLYGAYAPQMAQEGYRVKGQDERAPPALDTPFLLCRLADKEGKQLTAFPPAKPR